MILILNSEDLKNMRAYQKLVRIHVTHNNQNLIMKKLIQKFENLSLSS